MREKGNKKIKKKCYLQTIDILQTIGMLVSTYLKIRQKYLPFTLYEK